MGITMNEENWGAFSPLWMAKILTLHAPRENLNAAVMALLDMLFEETEDEDDARDGEEIIQTLVQVMGTGYRVAFGEHNFGPADARTMTQEELEEEVARFSEFLEKTVNPHEPEEDN